jgi:hypothetical protein
MSVTAGRRTAEDMALAVRKRPYETGDTVRLAKVGTLRSAGFRVERAPSRENPDHVSVEWPDEWDNTVETKFDSCFEESDG